MDTVNNEDWEPDEVEEIKPEEDEDPEHEVIRENAEAAIARFNLRNQKKI